MFKVNHEEYSSHYLLVNAYLYQLTTALGVCCPPVEKKRKFTNSQHSLSVDLIFYILHNYNHKKKLN